MTKYIISGVLAMGLILAVIGLSMKVSEQSLLIEQKDNKIKELQEETKQLIQSYEEDIAEREKKARSRRTIVKEIVKVAGNEKCINDPINPVVIERLQRKPVSAH